MCAPFGCWQPFTLHPYLGFFIYKVLQLFNPHIPLMSAVAMTPLFTLPFNINGFFMGLQGVGLFRDSLFCRGIISGHGPY